MVDSLKSQSNISLIAIVTLKLVTLDVMADHKRLRKVDNI